MFDGILLAKLQQLLGERGAKKDSAVRWRDLSDVYSTTDSRATTILTNANAALSQQVAAVSDAVIVASDQIAQVSAQVQTDLDNVNAAIIATNAAIDTNTGAISTAQSQLNSFQTDAEAELATLSGNIVGLETVLQSVQDDQSTLAATLTTNYYTKTNADLAIAAAKDELSASIDTLASTVQGYAVRLTSTDVVDIGAAVTVTNESAALGQSGTIKVVEGAVTRDFTGKTNGTSVTIPAKTALLLAGQRIKISVLAKKPVTGGATKFGIAYTSADGDSGYLVAEEDLTTAWAWFDFYYDVPTVVASDEAYIGIFGDDSQTSKATIFAVVSVDVAAVAGDSAAITALTATVSQNSSALVTLNQYAAATQTFRVVAGSAGASLELVASSDPINGAASTAKIAAQHFEVTAESMRITGGVGAALNLDPHMMDESAWRAGANEPNIVTLTDGKTGDKAMRGVAAAYRHYQTMPFAIDPTKKFRLRGTGRKSTSSADGSTVLRVFWYTSAKAQISWTDLNVTTLTTAFAEYLLSSITPPTNAAFAGIAVYPNYNATIGYHEWQGVFLEEQISSTLIVDGTIVGDKLAAGSVTADKISVTSLSAISANLGSIVVGTANIGSAAITAAKIADGNITAAKIADANITTAKIGDLQVNTLKIAGNAVTIFRGSRASGNAGSSGYTTIVAIGLTPTDGANRLLALVGASMTAYGGGGSSSGISCSVRLLWRGSVVREYAGVLAAGGASTEIAPLAITEILTTGSGYGELIFQISKGSTSSGSFAVDASLIIGEFKR